VQPQPKGTMTPTATIENDKTTAARLSGVTLENVRRNGGMQLEVPGPVVHHVRRGLHLALKAAAADIDAESASMADALRNRHAQMSSGYTAAISHFDAVRAMLDRLGWATQKAAPAPPVPPGVRRPDRSTAPPADVALTLFLPTAFGVIYEALALAVEDDTQAGRPASGLPALLDAMNTCIEDARLAYEEWVQAESESRDL
jgi:hypothetical protein